MRTILITLAVVAALGIYFLFDPAEARWMPKCPLKLITGLDCPGCGSQRMIHSLLHCDFRGAFRANALLLLALPFLGILGFAEIYRKKYPGLYIAIHRPWILWAAVGIICAWFLIRNWIGSNL